MGDVGYGTTAPTESTDPNGTATVIIGYDKTDSEDSSLGITTDLNNTNSPDLDGTHNYETPPTDPSKYSDQSIWVHNNVYGGNDVSGAVKKLADVQIYRGNILGNVHGAGNGNYLYALAKYGEEKVTVNDQQQYDQDDDETKVQYPLVYSVPMRESMASAKSASDAQKIVNINSWRPVTLASSIKIQGQGPKNKVVIKGKVFGGGNSATVQRSVETFDSQPSVTFNICSNVEIGEVFMGSDGDAMFSTDNKFLQNFQTINDLSLEDPIDWLNDPANHGISTTYLPTHNTERPLVYPHLLDLYFQPVEMDVQATLNWNGSHDGSSLSDCTIGTFCCGGNRGNMNVYPSTASGKEGNVIDYIFPENLTITNKIVGGCNNANYQWYNSNTSVTTNHTGGYLLGKRGSANPMIKLNVNSVFSPEVIGKDTDGKDKDYTEGLNVYGGCYYSGTINGDVQIDFRSNMLKDLKKASLVKANDDGVAVGNVYGAGYGTDSYVYGNVEVLMGNNHGSATHSVTTYGGDILSASDKTKYSVNYLFGGGQQGNVIGNTTVRLLNGYVFKSVTGSSYAGYQYGSTQVFVGYPSYYTCKKSGKYKLQRADKWNLQDDDIKDVIKTSVYLMKGDVVSRDVHDAINSYTEASLAAGAQITGNFSALQSIALSDYGYSSWDDINIRIDEAVYGGGYSLASGSSVGAGTSTVKKYNANYNIDDDLDDEDLTDVKSANGNDATQGFGGNTTVLVWDAPTKSSTADHISLSSQVMKEAQGLADGADLCGYYYMKKDGNYQYIYKAGTYKKTSGGPPSTLKDKDPDDNKIYEYDGEGGLFGDGHLSFAEGFRSGDLYGYGFAGSTPSKAKIINTFQRMDMLRLTDCAVVLLGARDYTVNEISTTPYSIARIGEIQMVAENVTNRTSGILAAKTVKKSRNYLGLSNNVHYCGAVYSNVKFSDKYHNRDGEIASNKQLTGDAATYRAEKQEYIDNKSNNAEFQKRNDGTAANMIGISSGYALKIQNIYSKNEGTQETPNVVEKLYYGPIVGVVEMNLINVQEGEGGGYVYADNIHHRKSASTPSSSKRRALSTDATEVPVSVEANEDFLETSGNFVFPYDVNANRWIVDDCFPTGYDNAHNTTTGVATLDCHYWYVTGWDYYYNVHITGYTYDSSSSVLSFNSENMDQLVQLSGAKAGQTVNLKSITWSSHNVADPFKACDLETSTEGGNHDTGYHNHPSSTTNDHYDYDHYNLFMSASGTETQYDESNSSTYWKNLPLTKGLDVKTDRLLENTIASESPSLFFQLTDKVDNSGTEYFEKYMSEPCIGNIVLTVQGAKEDGSYSSVSEYNDAKGTSLTDAEFAALQDYEKKKFINIYDFMPVTEFYTRGGSEGSYTYTAVTSGTLASGTTYYYLNTDGSYMPLQDGSLSTGGTGSTSDASKAKPNSLFTKKTSGDEVSYNTANVAGANTANTYYTVAPRYYTYTINLTIDYVQGPNYTGNITIENCALPGEMIRLSSKDVKITSDASLAPSGYFWRIGPLDENGTFANVEANKAWETSDADANVLPYNTYKQGEASPQDGLFKGCKYWNTENAVDIPAYYFMNGYGVQFGFTVHGIDNLFPVTMLPSNQLVVHNYHRMDPHDTATGDKKVNLHLAQALARAMKESTFPQPRIYISDEKDLNAFAQFVDTIGTGKVGNEIKGLVNNDKEYVYLGGKVDANKAEVPRYGEYAQFFIQKNLTANNYQPTDGMIFKGILHGDGHQISGIAVDKHLIPVNQGHVHNLGMLTGKIAGNNENGTYHCCYEYNTGAKDNSNSNKDHLVHYVYRIDGVCSKEHSDAIRSYDYCDDDFKYGEAAFDLNEYYLYRRYRINHPDEISVDDENWDKDHRQSPLRRVNRSDGKGAITYVEDYYANGDYQYAKLQDSDSGENSGVIYLRTTSDTPNYGSHDTYHNTNHPIDVPRANGYTAEHSATEEDVTNGKATAVGETVKEARTGNYIPLFNSICQTEGAVSDDASLEMNDYIFFGQSLQATCEAYPNTIASHLTSAATNRVWRASGFYGNMKDDAFHFNAYKQGSTSFGTYVHLPATTAIDFTCQRDTYDGNEMEYGQDYVHTNDNTTQTQHIFYAPAQDLPSTYASFVVKDGVTKNLLVYTADDNESTADEAYDVVHSTINYNPATAESLIKGHQVTGSGSSDYSTALLHLVERNANNKNGDGVVATSTYNNDFNCPIPFTVTDRAWYTRAPLYYAERTNSAWEGICLPFSVNKVTASYNGEISHFYGDDGGTNNADSKANGTNTTNVGHEYWLRGLTGVNGSNGTFRRPGPAPVSGDQSPEVFTGGSLTGSYIYDIREDGISLFKKHYGDIYDTQSIYESARTFAGYYFQQDHIPYIVSFPGKTFKEFDLSGEFNDQLRMKNHEQWNADNNSHSFSNLVTTAQTVTFEWAESERSGSSTVSIDGTHNTIPVTDDQAQAMTTTVSSAVHKATFAAIVNETAYGMNSEGTAFDDGIHNVLPFRTYMTTSSSAKPRYILIAQDGKAEEIDVEEDKDISESLNTPHLIIYPQGSSIIVESTYATTLKVYTTGGQLVRGLNITEGVNKFDDFQTGIYIVGKTKLRIK